MHLVEIDLPSFPGSAVTKPVIVIVLARKRNGSCCALGQMGRQGTKLSILQPGKRGNEADMSECIDVYLVLGDSSACIPST